MNVQFGNLKKIDQSNIGLLVCFTPSEFYGIAHARKDIYLHLMCKATYVEVPYLYDKVLNVSSDSGFMLLRKPEFILIDVNFGARNMPYDYAFKSLVPWLSVYRYSSTTFVDKLIEPFFVRVSKPNSLDRDTVFSRADVNKFLFRGINWPMLQMVFKRQNIAISPVNAGNRLFVNTLEMYFYKFLRGPRPTHKFCGARAPP